MAFAIMSAVGCNTARIGDFSILANDNIPLEMETLQKGVRGEDCAFIGFGFPSIEDAASVAQNTAPAANALQNAKVVYRAEYYVLVTRACYVVTGDAVRIRPPGVGASAR